MILKDKLSVQDFQKLHLAVGWKILDDKEIKTALKNSTFVVSAVVDNKTVGMARIVSDGVTHGLLMDVIVLPEYQKQGIGKAMVKHLMERCQQIANKHDEFMVELLPTCGNVDFYVKCGFKHLPDNMEGCYKWFKNQNIYCEGSKKHVSHLNQNAFNLIKKKQKTIEIRLNDEKRSKWKVGDVLIFVNLSNENQKLRAKIVALHHFKNFDELYKKFDKIALGYTKNETAHPDDMRKYYSAEEEKKYGVVGVELELI